MIANNVCVLFVFSSRRRHTRCLSDWSSDVCSSDLTNPNVVEHCRIRGVPIVPGVATPTDIELALSHGAETLKFFPAENMGGVSTLKALAGPFAGVRFI